MSLIVDSADSLFNYENTISAINLIPHSLYEIKLLFRHKSGSFRSYGIFKSDGNGRIDLGLIAPIRGTYTGIRPMGLFESYEPLTDFPYGGYAKYLASDIWNYELRLSEISGRLLDRVNMIKRFINPFFRRIEVEEEGIRGTLFIPPGNGPFPTIIDFSGTGGGINEQKGAALASEGFCVLTLAFFQFKDLPNSFYEVDLNYFINAVKWLVSRSFTTNRVGIHANSVGGFIALLMARECPEICAVVSIDPPHALNDGAHFQFNGEDLPYAQIEPSAIRFLNGIMCYDKTVRSMQLTKETELELHKIPKDVPIRFVVSLDDLSTCAHYSVNYLKKMLQESGHYVEVDWQSGGHLLEPPCFPHLGFCFTKISGMFMGYGGECSQHGVSQKKVWKATVDFFKKRLLDTNDQLISKL